MTAPTHPTRKQYNAPVAIRPDDTDREIMEAIRATLPAGANNTDVIRAALQSWADMQQIIQVCGIDKPMMDHIAYMAEHRRKMDLR